MIIDVLNRMLGLIEEAQNRDEEHSKSITHVSEMLKEQREKIKLLLERVERLENRNKKEEQEEETK